LIKLISQSKLSKNQGATPVENIENVEPGSAMSKTTDQQSLNISLLLDKQQQSNAACQMASR
jgi:hypothetical protein